MASPMLIALRARYGNSPERLTYACQLHVENAAFTISEIEERTEAQFNPDGLTGHARLAADFVNQPAIRARAKHGHHR